MAGIGFELQKVLKGGGIINIFKVALAGIIIVAGPWLISILGIFILNRYAAFALAEGADLFMAPIVYSYAFSLSLFGGLHYVFTRYIADLIYIRRERQASSALMLVLLLFGAAAAFIALIAFSTVRSEYIGHIGLYRFAGICLFAIINLIWLVMIFITLLKKYMTIFFVYLSGMIVSFGAVYILGQRMGIGGALAGFTLGQLVILLLLLILIVRHFPPVKIFREIKPLLGYFSRFRYLFLAGVFYSIGIWIDKITLWLIKGEAVRDTWFQLFGQYDISVYFANLTIIPGLVYFMIFSETDFYRTLKKFLLSVEKGILTKITEEKYKVLHIVGKSLYEQSLFQGILTLALILLAPSINLTLLGGSSDPATLRIVLSGAFFNIFFLTNLTFLFYIEMYRPAFFSSFLYFAVNLIITWASAAAGFTVYGTGYLTAGILSSVIALSYLSSGIRKLDRRIFSKI